MNTQEPTIPAPGYGELFRVWFHIGCVSFGGPAGQIALMHRVLVDEKKWLDEDRFLHALSFCMLLPGPEAQQLATYSGWLLRGWRGGLIAGGLFVLPGFLVVLALSAAYVLFAEISWFEALFTGLKAAVLVIVIDALIRIARRALKSSLDYALAGLAFAALFVFDLPFPLTVLGAGLIGFFWHRESARPAESDAATLPAPERGNWLLTSAVWLAVWAAPFGLILALTGPSGTFWHIARFFSQMAVVTFGGAYAVLAYVAQQAVENFGWLLPGEMLDGLGLAETTPGPLVLVLTFVGFLAGFRDGTFIDPMLSGLAGAALATWVTFAPCFLFVFAGAPHIERLRSNRRLSAALAAITAAVVGVILNLALWFALHVLFAETVRFEFGFAGFDLPVPASLDGKTAALAILAGLALFGLRWSVLILLPLAALAGVALDLLLPGSGTI